MSVAHDVEALLAQLGPAANVRVARIDEGTSSSPRSLALSWPELNAVLPDAGLPRGVVELAAPCALGGSTSVALSAVRAGQTRGTNAWCAWLDPEATLHAPGVVASGVDLERMLVVRAPRGQLGRVAVKVVTSGAFEVVVVDFNHVPHARSGVEAAHERLAPEVLVRKLALAAEPNGTIVLLLTDAAKSRAIPWPVAMRIELSRSSPRELVVRVAKDKRGRVGLAKTIPLRPFLRAAV